MRKLFQHTETNTASPTNAMVKMLSRLLLGYPIFVSNHWQLFVAKFGEGLESCDETLTGIRAKKSPRSENARLINEILDTTPTTRKQSIRHTSIRSSYLPLSVIGQRSNFPTNPSWKFSLAEDPQTRNAYGTFKLAQHAYGG